MTSVTTVGVACFSDRTTVSPFGNVYFSNGMRIAEPLAEGGAFVCADAPTSGAKDSIVMASAYNRGVTVRLTVNTSRIGGWGGQNVALRKYETARSVSQRRWDKLPSDTFLPMSLKGLERWWRA